jgi:hypothetical protein
MLIPSLQSKKKGMKIVFLNCFCSLNKKKSKVFFYVKMTWSKKMYGIKCCLPIKRKTSIYLKIAITLSTIFQKDYEWILQKCVCLRESFSFVGLGLWCVLCLILRIKYVGGQFLRFFVVHPKLFDELKKSQSKFSAEIFTKKKKIHFACCSQFFFFRYSHPWNVMFFWREIQISWETIFAAMNFKKIKDDYNGKFVEILEKIAKWSNWIFATSFKIPLDYIQMITQIFIFIVIQAI